MCREILILKLKSNEMRAIFLLCLMGIGIMFPQISSAQNPVIKGQVVDAKTNESLPGVTIVIKGTLIGSSIQAKANRTNCYQSAVQYTHKLLSIGSSIHAQTVINRLYR
jgi:hypothetical protein